MTTNTDTAAAVAPADDLATSMVAPTSRLEKVLGFVPRALASKPHIILLIGLGGYLILLPLLHIYTPSGTQMLIGGNYTNVTSDLGACIAAGGTLHVIRQNRSRHRMEEERLRLARETHRLLHVVHAETAKELGQNA
jgi:hypothetical protein